MKKYLRYCTAVILSAAFVLMLCVPALAEDGGEARVVKVAFPQIKGLTETAADGTRSGLVVDYLNEIAKYTGWEYEYIDTTGDTMLDEFLNGDYELMGGNYYYPGLEEYYAYPEYNTGYSKSALFARANDYSIHSYDLESLNGKTIGVYERAAENVRRLKEYLTINNLNCTLKYYSYEQLSEDGTLYPYLESGEVDLVLGNTLEVVDSFRVVVSYESQPYYIVTNIGNQEILDGLNMALEKILDANPNFAEERYKANFPDRRSIDIQLNEEELAYIRQRDAVTVAVTKDWHPMFCLDQPDGMHYGVVPDILAEITAFSGLRFTYVYAENYIDAVRMVQDGEADILGFFLDSEKNAAQSGLALSSSYVNLNNIVVRNKTSTYPAEGLVGATIEGRELPSDITAAKVVKYPSITEALRAVDKGEADFVYGIASRMEKDIQRYHFSNLVSATLVNDRSDYSFALKRPVEPQLLTIINKAVNNLSAEEKADILNRNLVSIGSSQLSLTELVYSNPVMFVSIIAIFLFLLVIGVLLITRARIRAAVMQSNLEKAEAESRAKGEFLSRMSHEIRTPMNAVVGLADLTSMMEELPDPVRQNLSKIRSSSNYLLSLINDILDMSRIDSGMLSIASEPFSMERMLSDLQSMMLAESQRRGLDFTMEKEIVHSELIGDSIRLRQVLTNLLSNAFKFTPAGKAVCLRATETSSTENEATFTFRVIDNGVGIQPEDQKRIFDSFEQLGASSSKSQGTGLGLTISRNIVQLMGGDLSLNSELGKGSEFYFTITLPIGRAAEESESLVADHLLEGVRVLLAEDNDLNAEIAIQLLEIQGAAVHRSENGRLAVEDFVASRPGEYHVILMDIQMPEMTGLEATRAIRKLDRPDASSIPIIAMTANSFKEDADAAADAGMNGFCSKPLDVKHLYALVRSVLKEND